MSEGYTSTWDSVRVRRFRHRIIVACIRRWNMQYMLLICTLQCVESPFVRKHRWMNMTKTSTHQGHSSHTMAFIKCRGQRCSQPDCIVPCSPCPVRTRSHLDPSSPRSTTTPLNEMTFSFQSNIARMPRRLTTVERLPRVLTPWFTRMQMQPLDQVRFSARTSGRLHDVAHVQPRLH